MSTYEIILKKGDKEVKAVATAEVVDDAMEYYGVDVLDELFASLKTELLVEKPDSGD